MKIAYICYDGPLLTDEDGLLLNFLQQKRLDIQREIWTDTSVNWQQYDLAILKSPWDYIDKITVFYDWLSMLEGLGVRLLNPYATVRWNSDKHYLKEMIAAGFPVIPATFIEKGEVFDYPVTEKLIIKPCVSGGAKHTFIVTPERIPEINLLLQEEAFMLQPFMKEIQEEGEWSFLFFNGRFSHCLLKTPVDGDFRVQHQFGGRSLYQQPPADHLFTASSFVERFAKGCLYARVDGVVKDGQFLLMELELIEPLLFLATHEGSYENYYQALKEIAF
jgi:glutathione synthase/RimK-type ligase-like ATP-grasp enzyme